MGDAAGDSRGSRAHRAARRAPGSQAARSPLGMAALSKRERTIIGVAAGVAILTA